MRLPTDFDSSCSASPAVNCNGDNYVTANLNYAIYTYPTEEQVYQYIHGGNCVDALGSLLPEYTVMGSTELECQALCTSYSECIGKYFRSSPLFFC